MTGVNPYDMRHYGPQQYGQRVIIPLADPVLALGQPSLGTEREVLRMQRDDEEAESVDITLSASKYAPFASVPPPGNPLSELVAVLIWGQQRADSNGEGAGGAIAAAPIRCEVDWLHGTILSVPGSYVQVYCRWDNWDLAGVGNPGPGMAGYPFTRWVQAMLCPRSNSHHNLRPQRTMHFWNPIAAGAFDGRTIPAYARSVQLVSPTATTWTVRLQQNFGFSQLANMTVVGGTVSPELPIPNGTEYVRVDNVGGVAGICSLIWYLAL